MSGLNQDFWDLAAKLQKQKTVTPAEVEKLDRLGRSTGSHVVMRALPRIKASLPPTDFGRKGNPVSKKNPVSIADKPAVTELVLYAENVGPGSQGHERALWNQRVSIIANLKRKAKKGIYDKALAAKLWTYWADSAAKAYEVYHGSGKPSLVGSPFTAATRREAAKIFEANFRDEVHEGMKTNPVPRPTGGTYGAGARLRARDRAGARKPRHAQYVIAIRRTTGAIQFYTGAGFGPRSQAAHFMNTDTAQQVAGNLQYKSVIAPYSTPEKTIRAALLGKK